MDTPTWMNTDTMDSGLRRNLLTKDRKFTSLAVFCWLSKPQCRLAYWGFVLLEMVSKFYPNTWIFFYINIIGARLPSNFTL